MSFVFLHTFCAAFMRNIQTAVSRQQLKIGHVYMNLFTLNSSYYHLLIYLFIMKHSVCVCVYIYIYIYILMTFLQHVSVKVYHLKGAQNVHI